MNLPTENRASRPLPVPTLDHVVVNARDGLAAMAAQYRRLGFTLTPQGRHTLGSINHLAMFGTDYLELVGVPPEGAPGSDVLDWPAGLNGLVFGCEDAAGTHAALVEAGAPVLPPLAFSRPVALPDGPRDAAFQTVRVPAAVMPAGRVYFCHHLTRDVVWRDDWRRHANGTVGIAGLVIAAADPARIGDVFRRMFGADAVVARPGGGGCRLWAGLTAIDVLTPPAVARRFNEALPPYDALSERMVALVLRTASLRRTREALLAGGVAHVGGVGWLRVPARHAGGTALEWRAD